MASFPFSKNIFLKEKKSREQSQFVIVSFLNKSPERQITSWHGIPFYCAAFGMCYHKFPWSFGFSLFFLHTLSFFSDKWEGNTKSKQGKRFRYSATWDVQQCSPRKSHPDVPQQPSSAPLSAQVLLYSFDERAQGSICSFWLWLMRCVAELRLMEVMETYGHFCPVRYYVRQPCVSDIVWKARNEIRHRVAASLWGGGRKDE